MAFPIVDQKRNLIDKPRKIKATTMTGSLPPIAI